MEQVKMVSCGLQLHSSPDRKRPEPYPGRLGNVAYAVALSGVIRTHPKTLVFGVASTINGISWGFGMTSSQVEEFL